MTNLTELVIKNKDKKPRSMNAALQRFARENGLRFQVGNNDPFSIAPEEHQEQAVEVNQDFVKTLELLGAKMNPTLEELGEMQKKLEDTQHFTSNVEIYCNEKIYKGEVYLGILSKFHTFWMNTTEWEDISK